METNLEHYLDDLLKNATFTGAICVDKQGLCVMAKGTATPECAGVIACLAQQARGFNTEAPEPVIVVETDQGKLIIKKHEDITVGLFQK